jgi:predicted Fe-S protein YdhL (DUF1289 family)
MAEIEWEKPENALELIAARADLARATVENVPSPCISVCRMSEIQTWCEGCYRSIEEIRQWSTASDADKKLIWARIEARFAPELA